jgi:integrase
MRGKKFWISYYAPKNGKSVEHRESAGKTEAEARKLLKARLQEIAVHRVGVRTFQGPRADRVTVEELLTPLERDYEIQGRKSLPQLRSHLRHIRAFFAMDRAIAVTTNRLRDYIAHRQEEGAASATINRELEGLQRAFALAVEGGTLSMAPNFPALSERNARQGFFERADFEAVLSHLDDSDLEDYLRWFYWTGMRPGEIQALTWAGFDRETWTLRLHARDAKTGHGRMLSLVGDLRFIIERRLKARRLDSPLVFHRNGKPVGEYRKRWKKACEAAGVVGRIPYDLRRTAVRNMIRAGVDQAVAMKISGHRTDAVFRRYNIVSDEDIRDAMVKTEAYVDKLPQNSGVIPLAGKTAQRKS